MKVQLSCGAAVLFVILALPNLLTADDSSNQNQDYEDEDSDGRPPENVDFEPVPNWTEEEIEMEMSVTENEHCPPPARTLLPELCNRTSCTHDNNCSRSKDNSTTLVCCFNGCTRACVHPLDPPIALDWIEKPTHVKKFIATSEAAHSSAPESMALPGGCVVSPMQYKKLETFKRNQHVTHCFCDIGGIFCKIAES